MKLTRIMLSASALFMLATTLSTVSAATTGGTVQFSGALVEPTCDSNIVNGSITSRCLGQGKATVHRWSTNLTQADMPQRIGQADVRWLDTQHKIGILTLSYH